MASINEVMARLKGTGVDEAWRSQPHVMLDGWKVRLVDVSPWYQWRDGARTDEVRTSDDGERMGVVLDVVLIDSDGRVTSVDAPLRLRKYVTADDAAWLVDNVGSDVPTKGLRVVFATRARTSDSGFANMSTEANVDFELGVLAASKGGE